MEEFQGKLKGNVLGEKMIFLGEGYNQTLKTCVNYFYLQKKGLKHGCVVRNY